MRLEQLAHCHLPRTSNVYKPTVLLNEEIEPISLEPMVRQRMLRAKLRPQVVDSHTYFIQRYSVLAADGIQDMRLNQIDKGQNWGMGFCHCDDGSEESLASFGWIRAPRHPRPNSGARDQ